MSLCSTASDTILYLRPSSPESAAADPLCHDFRDAYEALARDIAQRAVSEGKMGKKLVGGRDGEFEIQLSEWRAALKEARLQLSQTQTTSTTKLEENPAVAGTRPTKVALATLTIPGDNGDVMTTSPMPNDGAHLVEHVQELRLGAEQETSTRHSSETFAAERYDRPARPGYVPAQTAHVLWLGNLVQSTSLAQLRDLLFSDIPSAHHLRSILHLPQSKCAFANYSSEAAMMRAMRVYNGRSIPKMGQNDHINLICKIRMPEEIQKGPHQRGIHKLGIAEPVAKNLASTDLRKHPSTSSISTASTTSTFLARHYPTRYFILKSRTVNELEKAAETNRWRPQLHNEVMLRRAHRCGEVIIIFSANGTGNFWGVARMAGSLDRGKSAQSELALEQVEGKTASVPLPYKDEREEIRKMHTALPTARRSQESDSSGSQPKSKPPLLRLPSEDPSLSASPKQLSPTDEKPRAGAQPHRPPIGSASSDEPIRKDFLQPGQEPKKQAERLEESEDLLGMDDPRTCNDPLDANIPPPGIIGEAGKGVFWEREHHPNDVPENPTEPAPQMALATPFPLEWLFTTPLPFSQVKGLRNPWNGNKEVKVARDGIEVEPSVGRQILGAFWNYTNKDNKMNAGQWTAQESEVYSSMPPWSPATTATGSTPDLANHSSPWTPHPNMGAWNNSIQDVLSQNKGKAYPGY